MEQILLHFEAKFLTFSNLQGKFGHIHSFSAFWKPNYLAERNLVLSIWKFELLSETFVKGTFNFEEVDFFIKIFDVDSIAF